MDKKLTIDCPEYRRAVELLAAMVLTFKVDEKLEFVRAFGMLCGGDEEAFGEYLERVGEAFYRVMDNRPGAAEGANDASKLVATRLVQNAFVWTRELFQEYSSCSNAADFAEKLLGDVGLVGLTKEQEGNQDGQT